MPGIEDKILAEDGERDVLAGIAQILEGATEEFALGENGESGGASGFERFGESGRVEGVTDDAARRRGGLELGDDVESVTGERGREIADRRGGFDAVFERGLRQNALAVIDFSAAGFEDAVENSAGVGLSVHEAEIVC